MKRGVLSAELLRNPPPPLSKEENGILRERLEKNPDDTDARQRLVCGHLLFALQIARKYAYLIPLTGVAFDDLASAAFFGLCEASGGFDATKKKAFSTYAESWITKHLLEKLSESRVIKIPEKLEGKFYHYLSGIEEYCQKNDGKWPSRKKWMQMIRLSPSIREDSEMARDIERLAGIKVVSLQESTRNMRMPPGKKERSYDEFVPQNTVSDPADIVEIKMFMSRVERLLGRIEKAEGQNSLIRRSIAVFKLRYGLPDWTDPEPFLHIAKIMDVARGIPEKDIERIWRYASEQESALRPPLEEYVRLWKEDHGRRNQSEKTNYGG